ncbi:sugar ABC transporter substrate-binding protein [Paenibacillus sp. PL2-23]|uniref:ABC transporter substrate-binding protein n=1 Tax=Paenibacillus sp. PL2-23 TaxID=2100729 RepID=UPI0030F64C2B
MVNKTFLRLLCVTLIIVLAACSSNNSSNTESPKTAQKSENGQKAEPQEKTVIKYWTDDRHDAEYIKQIISDFNATNEDGIEVELNVLSDNFKQAVDIAYSTAQAPDVLRIKTGVISEFVKKGYLEPIDSYVTPEMLSQYKPVDGASTFDGKLYSLPHIGTTQRLIYNKDLFAKAGIEAPPESLAQLVEAAKKITEVGKAEGAYGLAMDFKNPSSAFSRAGNPILSLSGYGHKGYDMKTGAFDFTGYGELAEAFRQMKVDGSLLPGFEALAIDPLRAQFAQGKIGMYLSYSVEPGVYNTQFPTEVNWGVAIAPTLTGERNGASAVVGTGTFLGLSSESEHKDAAWKFISHMYSKEVLQPYHEQGLGIIIIPHITDGAKKPEAKGIDGFLITEFDGVWPEIPAVTPDGLNYADALFRYIIEGGDKAAIIADVNARYNAALEKVKASGEVFPVDPSFDPKSLRSK